MARPSWRTSGPFISSSDTGRPRQTEAEVIPVASSPHGLIAAKRDNPGDDLLSQLVAVHDEQDGRLSEEELVATILAMLVGGYESTVNQIGKGLLVLFRHPEATPLPGDTMVGGARVDTGSRPSAPRRRTTKSSSGERPIQWCACADIWTCSAFGTMPRKMR